MNQATPMLAIVIAFLALGARAAAPSPPPRSATAAPARAAASADSLALRLARAESAASGARAAGEAALLLGRLHYARGEYRNAADAFARAAARLDPARKSEALYWAGMSWLGQGSPGVARAQFEEVAASDSRRRADALLGIASAWERESRPDKAIAALDQLLAGDPGEAGPAALARMAALADRLHRPADAARARARLLAAYPASMEAAMADAAISDAAAAVSPSGAVALEVGRFASASRAKSLAARATRAGFPDAKVVGRGGEASRVYAVLLGSYPDRAAARKAQAVAARQLGLNARLTGER
jgi:tetratricopeptide (TPR) repeat protein